MFAWGCNSHGQLGCKKNKERLLAPKKVSYFNKKDIDIRHISAGDTHCIAHGERDGKDGLVYTWGESVLNGFR